MATTMTVIPRMKKLRMLTMSGPVSHLSSSAYAVPLTIANLIKSTTTMNIAE